MGPQLSGVTDLTLSFINLESDEYNDVAKCIVNYTQQRNGLTEKVSYVVYIVIEDIKHLFEKSDWDKAVKALEQKTTRAVPTVLIRLLPDSTVKKTSEFGLQQLIKVNRWDKVPVPQSVINYVEENCTVDQVITAIADYIQKL